MLEGGCVNEGVKGKGGVDAGNEAGGEAEHGKGRKRRSAEGRGNVSEKEMYERRACLEASVNRCCVRVGANCRGWR